MFDFLDHNTTLTSLNIANNALNKDCGSKLRQKLGNNTALIDLDFSNNDFKIEDSRAIQKYLQRNKALSDAEKLKEWKQRKLMREEDQHLKQLQLSENAGDEVSKMENEARRQTELDMNEKWKKFMLETELEKQNVMN
jgi:hypothetical protein